MKEILSFLRELQENNNRPWFQEHREQYLSVLDTWQKFCRELITEVGTFDPDIAHLTVQDCTYRIYRDTRFSNDKRPYKTHFGVFMAPGGKKSMHAGYYFHVGTGLEEGYPSAHMLASGNYCYEKEAIRILREDISAEWEEFSRDVLQKADPRLEIDMEGALKNVPKPYPADAPYSTWMRLKNFCLSMVVDDGFILEENLVERVARIFQTTKPFNDYINRAVDYSREY